MDFNPGYVDSHESDESTCVEACCYLWSVRQRLALDDLYSTVYCIRLYQISNTKKTKNIWAQSDLSVLYYFRNELFSDGNKLFGALTSYFYLFFLNNGKLFNIFVFTLLRWHQNELGWHYCSDQLALFIFFIPVPIKPGMFCSWAASQMAGQDDWLLSAVAQGSCRDHHTTTSRPSVCLSVFVVSERQLTVKVRVGWVHAGGNAFESTPTTAATIIIALFWRGWENDDRLIGVCFCWTGCYEYMPFQNKSAETERILCF